MKTEVIFRTDKEGETIAVLPYEIADTQGNCTCFCKSEGHSACAWEYVLKDTKPTQHYNDLMNLMIANGYNLEVIRRREYDKYLEAYYRMKRHE